MSVNLTGFKERRKSTSSRCGRVESESVVEAVVVEEEKEGELVEVQENTINMLEESNMNIG